jgi:hypothetical protein
MQRQLETFYGGMLACAGFGIWAIFSLMPALTGQGVREAWDSAPFWILGVPLLLALHGFAGALTEEGAWRLPLWAIGGHIAGMMLIHPTGTGLGLLPFAVVIIGVPMYVILLLATLTGRMIGRHVGST